MTTTDAHEGEAGVTLIELAMTTMLLGIVLAMVVQVMITVQSTVEVEAGRSARNDRLRLAVRSLERQIRSGEIVGDPSTENDAPNEIVPGMSVRLLTRSTGAAATVRCAQWRIAGERLESRQWSPAWPVDADVTGWQVTADGIENRATTPGVDAFTLASDPAYGGRVLQIRLLARGDGPADARQLVETSATGRSAVVGNPATTCDNVPPH